MKRNETNLRTFCFSDYHYAFQETLCPVTLARSLDLFILFKLICLYFRPILARFSHILVYTNFFLMCITTQNICLILCLVGTCRKVPPVYILKVTEIENLESVL